MSRKFVQRSASLLVMFMLSFGLAGTVLADAGNPILGTINAATSVVNPDGTVTVTVRGQWNWLTHNADCNFDRAATGAAMIWNDPTETGYLLSKGGVTAQVGIRTHNTIGQTWVGFPGGTDPNPLDPMVHPVDRGNIPEGLAGPAGQLFVDPVSNNPAEFASWKGGCGRSPVNVAPYTGDPYGSWGYDVDNNVHAFTHTYRQVSDVSKVCVNFYDVHGGGLVASGKFQLVKDANEITVDKNGDNSIETNAFNVNDGANCISVKPTPSLVTQASGPVSVGDPITDTATLSGGSNPTGTIVFSLYGPDDDTCFNNPIFLSTKTVTGNGDYTSDPFTPTAPGAYRWVANYLGDVNHTATSNACNEANETSIVQPADIQISKTPDNLNPVSAGDSIGFTLTVYNAGAGNATGVKLTDTLPTNAGLAWTIADQGAGWGGTCAIAAGVLTCGGAAGVTVPGNTTQAASTFTVHITSPTTAATGGTCPDGTGTVSNTGEVTSGNDGSDESTAVECVQVGVVQIAKTPDHAAPVSAGDSIGFTLTVFNDSAGGVAGVKLNDTLPTNAGLDWTVADQGAGWGGTCAIAAGVLTCGGAAGVTVPGNTTQAASTFTVHMTSTTTAATGGVCPSGTGTVSNTGEVTSSNDGSDESTAVECVQAADVQIVKTPDHAAPVNAGEQIGFTLTVSNAGAGNATGVKINDTLPTNAGLAWTIQSQGAGWAGAPCAIAAGELTCGGAAGVTVPGGTTHDASTFTVHITSPTTAATGGVCPDGTGTVSNTGEVTSGNDGDDQSTAVECVQAGDIRIVKTPDHAAPVNAGEQIGFTLTVFNAGAGSATGVKLTDTLPTDPGLSWTIAGPGAGWAGTCAIATGTLTCGGAAGVTVPGNLTQAASTFTVHITSTTTAATGGICPTGTGTVSNTGMVTSGNDGDDQSTAVECVKAADIKIVKVADDASVNPGDQVGFTIKVWNAGAGAATGVKLTDTLPTDAGLSWTIQSQGAGWAGSCAIAAGSLTCGGATGKTVAGGTTQAATTFTVHIVSPTTLATATTSPIDNQACVSTTNDGSGCSSDEIDVFSLTLTKDNNAPDREIELPDGTTITLPTQDEGKLVTYTLTYDVGASAVSNAILTDVLPAGVTFQASPAPTSTNPQLTFVGYTPATRTLTWHADTLSVDGSVTYVVKVDVGANTQSQPLVNHAAIELEETPEDTAESEFFVPPPPKVETKVPTGPPTDSFATTEGTTNGSSLLVILSALGVVIVAVSVVTPIRRRHRR